MRAWGKLMDYLRFFPDESETHPGKEVRYARSPMDFTDLYIYHRRQSNASGDGFFREAFIHELKRDLGVFEKINDELAEASVRRVDMSGAMGVEVSDMDRELSELVRGNPTVKTNHLELLWQFLRWMVALDDDTSPKDNSGGIYSLKIAEDVFRYNKERKIFEQIPVDKLHALLNRPEECAEKLRPTRAKQDLLHLVYALELIGDKKPAWGNGVIHPDDNTEYKDGGTYYTKKRKEGGGGERAREIAAHLGVELK
ncbi:MAG: hypothetical protein EAS52_18570 [Parapedobacter sp.]|nr:MAG: hypothetical protein EAS52_18570 [Parapedobacter sp.]